IRECDDYEKVEFRKELSGKIKQMVEDLKQHFPSTTSQTLANVGNDGEPQQLFHSGQAEFTPFPTATMESYQSNDYQNTIDHPLHGASTEYDNDEPYIGSIRQKFVPSTFDMMPTSYYFMHDRYNADTINAFDMHRHQNYCKFSHPFIRWSTP